MDCPVVATAGWRCQMLQGHSPLMFNPDRHTHCYPCEFDLSDSQGKKEIAATIRSSDG